MQKTKITLELDESLNMKLSEKSRDLEIPKKVIIKIALDKFLEDIERLGVKLQK